MGKFGQLIELKYGTHQRRQTKLIDSASELIHSRSYADVGVNELCEHAGVKKGSFYHFFPNRPLCCPPLTCWLNRLSDVKLVRPSPSNSLSLKSSSTFWNSNTSPTGQSVRPPGTSGAVLSATWRRSLALKTNPSGSRSNISSSCS